MLWNLITALIQILAIKKARKRDAENASLLNCNYNVFLELGLFTIPNIVKIDNKMLVIVFRVASSIS